MTDATAADGRPSILFVCVRNGGKSQMAAALLRRAAGDAVVVSSAGTEAGDSLTALSVEVLAEIGIDISSERTRQLTPELVTDADLVITLGREAVVDPGSTGENWDTDEPSTRGIEGIERMRLIRDDIAARVEALIRRLAPEHAGWEHGEGVTP